MFDHPEVEAAKKMIRDRRPGGKVGWDFKEWIILVSGGSIYM